MTRDELKQSFRDATSSPPPGVKDRVWRGLSARPRVEPQRAWLRPALVLAVSAVVGVVVTRAALSRESSGEWQHGASAAAWTHARVATPAPQHLVLERGELAVSSWGAPVEVKAGAHVIVVEHGVALVRVAGESVTAEVVEGALWFDGEARTNPRVQKTALTERAVLLEGPEARPARLSALAEQAQAERRFEEAAKAWAEVASSGSLDAEVANFKQGELELRELNRPQAALATFEAGEARFPAGALTQERQLSAIESCLRLGQWAEVARRTSAFLASHPGSERVDELRRLNERATACLAPDAKCR